MEDMAMMGSSKVLAAAAHGFENFVLQAGGDPDSILGDVGLTLDHLREPTHPIPLANYCRMLETASERSKSPDFGLLYGSQFQPEMFGLIGFIALASPTAGAALQNFADLFRFHQNGTETRLFAHQGMLRLEYKITDSRIMKRSHDAEFTIAAFANVLRRVLGEDWTPVQVEFEHESPECLSRHHQIFDANVMFGKSANALIFRPEQLDAPLPGGNAPLLDVLCASLTAVSCDNGQDDSSDLLTRARNEIQSRMAEGSVSLKSVADGLKAPVWTLQRRLRDQGITFSELVEDVRRKLARHYVHQSGIPLTEVALLLGYSEASAFSRAFRQWYGVSPRTLRTHHRASRPGQ